MLHFNTESWHYRLVLYVFGVNFFTERDTIDMIEYRKSTKIIWTRKPKVVNFCPYCRGVLWSICSLPFVYGFRVFFPHDPTKVMTHAQTMRRMKIRGTLIKCIAGGVQFPFALGNYLNGEYTIAAFEVILGVLLIGVFVFIPGNKRIIKFFSSPINKHVSNFFKTLYKKCLWPLIEPIVKCFEEKDKNKVIKEKNPSIVVTFLQSKHHAMCPPVCFIAKSDQDKLR